MNHYQKEEFQQLAFASILVLGVFISLLVTIPDINILTILFFSFGALIIYLLHEYGHYRLASHYGFYSSYRLIKEGVIITAISIIPFFPIKFIAPGTVDSRARSNNQTIDQLGKIALIGPLINLILGGFMLVIIGFISFSSINIRNYLGLDLFTGFKLLGILSLSIALFNMLPFPPMDGYKVLNWDKDTYIVMIIIMISAWFILYIY